MLAATTMPILAHVLARPSAPPRRRSGWWRRRRGHAACSYWAWQWRFRELPGTASFDSFGCLVYGHDDSGTSEVRSRHLFRMGMSCRFTSPTGPALAPCMRFRQVFSLT